jgi:phosphohistidine phosphatase
MILYIVRHGIAVDRDDPKCPPEAERPLTAEGVKKTRSAALGMKSMGAKPDLLITSPLVRAAQTAEIFAEVLGYAPAKIRATDSLMPAANPTEFIRELTKIRAKEIACFGHAPHLDMLIAQMAGARGVFTQIKKAGAACLEQTGGKWELRWMLAPKVLRQLAE